MQLRHLETFVSIVDAGTLTAAAVQLYKTQGAVSQDLKALEAGLDLQLIDRSGQRIRLTQAGLALLPMARRLLAEVTDTRDEMARIRAGERPIVRITCLPSVAMTVSRLLADFRGEHPDTRGALITSLRGLMIEGLRDGHFDLAICEASNDEGIANIPLAREALHVVLPEGHPLAASRWVTPEDLADVPYIGFARGMGATLEAQRFFSAGEAYPTPVIEVNEARLVFDLVTRLGGFGIVPDSALSNDLPLAVLRSDPPLLRQISVAHLAARELPSAAEAFARYVVENWPSPSSEA